MNPLQPLGEKAQKAFDILMEQFWIVRDREPENYRMIRECEQELRSYLHELLGFRLTVHLHFIKLEKIPPRPESWMGIPSFTTNQHYGMFCCLLAFLEEKQIHSQQFILSELCEYIKMMYPVSTPIHWENHEHRRILVHVIKFAEKLGILCTVEGQIEHYSGDIEIEVLYNIESVSRYVMRFFPHDLTRYKSFFDLVPPTSPEEETAKDRKTRLYQQLYLSPVLYMEEWGRKDFEWMRSKHSYLREEIEGYTPYQFELYQNAALLVLNQDDRERDLFPSRTTLDAIGLQLAALVRERVKDQILEVSPDGILRLTYGEWEQLVHLCKMQKESGWNKKHREASVSKIAAEVLENLIGWRMANYEPSVPLVQLYPLFARLVGEYPPDYAEELEAARESLG
jgi:uncharacterized protein (TIGR02678 family)